MIQTLVFHFALFLIFSQSLERNGGMKKRPVPLPPEQLPEKPMDLSSMVPPTSMSSGIVI